MRRSWVSRVLLASLLFASPLFTSLAREANAESEARSIEVHIAGDTETTLALQSGLSEFAEQRDVGVGFRLERSIQTRDVLAEPDEGSSELARIWLDVRAQDKAVLYIVDTTSDRILLRVVPLEAGYDEVARESLGNIVESAIDALLAGAEIGERREVIEAQVRAEEAPPAEPLAKRAEPEPKRAAPAAAAEQPNTLGLGGFLGYRVDSLRSREAVRHGPELGAVLVWEDGNSWSPAGWLWLGYRLPSDWQSEDVELRLQGGGARLLAGVISPAAFLRVQAGFGAGIEAMRIETEPRSPRLAARDPQWTVSPVGVAGVGVGVELTDELRLNLAGFAELDFLGHHFDVVRDGAASPSLEPWLVRPAAALTLQAGLE